MPSLLVPFVGRAAEVTAVEAALDAAAAGVAGVVGLAGEPGAGKSRLAEEASALARARGFLTLRAAASPLHADLPYAVVVEALRPVVLTVEAGARTRLVEGLPDLGRLFDGLNLPAPPPLGDPSMERTRLFEAVCRLFDRLTRQQPVLLVVDDLHWADPTSVALLHYVMRGVTDRRFLLLVTRRIGDHGRELEALWSALRQSGVLTELTVGSLDASGVAALARGLLADDPPATLAGLLVERTRGLPLFVRALVTMLIDSGRLFRSGGRWVLGQDSVDDVPPELVGLLRSRLDALHQIDRSVLDIVAVAGGVVGHDLMSVLHPDEAELLGCVKRLRGAGLLVEELGDEGVRYQVAHPLLAEVAYDELPAIGRRRMHAAIASALLRIDPGEVGRLAHHVRGAGEEIDTDTALDVLVTAVGAALESKAGDEAAAHAEAAIGLARRLGREQLLSRLRQQRAEALELAGRGDAAIAAWRAAAESAASCGSTVEHAGRLRRLAIAEWDTGRLADSQHHIDEATAILTGTPVGPVPLDVAETRLRMLARRGQLAELRTDVAELSRIAAATGSARALAIAHWGEADLCLHTGDHQGTERAVAAMMQLARAENSVLLLEQASRPAACNALAWGDHQAARRLAAEGRRLARETGVPALEIVAAVGLAFVGFVAGAWDEASAGADEVLALSHRVGMRRGAAAALCVRALIHTRRGQLTDAAACLREAGAVYHGDFAGDRHLLGVGEVCEAMILLGRGDSGSALRVAASVPAAGLAVPAFRLSVLGEAQVAAGALTGARETAALLAGHGPGAPYPAAASAWVLGLAARAAGDIGSATAAFGRASVGFAALAMPYEAAIARLDWAEVIAGEGSADERDRAAAQLSENLDVLDRLGARPAADRTRRLLRHFGVRPAVAPRSRRPGQLSPREDEIARLVAEGLSNMEIAERLFISQRTVTTHLQRIYQRLGVGSRTGLTRYVVEHVPADRQNT